MTMTLLLAKIICQALLCWGEMDVHSLGADTLPVAKKPPVPASDDDEAPIYVGAWIRAHGYKPAEVARGAPINEGYLSGIISGKKKNPTRAMLKRIATFLEIGVGDLYRPPPTAAVLDQVAKYDPGVVLRLSEKRKKSG